MGSVGLLTALATGEGRRSDADSPISREGGAMELLKDMVTTSVTSLDGEWLLMTDPEDAGRERKWFSAPAPGAKQANVPGIIQESFPAYHGVAWYWRDFISPLPRFKTEKKEQWRYLLRFWAVDYLADVWLNDVWVGRHEGSETPFVLDVTDVIKPTGQVGSLNRIAVRALNPTNELIDGMRLNETPRRAKIIPYSAGSSYDSGGIVDSVEILITPLVRIEDLHVWSESKTGIVHIETNVRNAGSKPAAVALQFTVSPAESGETLDVAGLTRELPPGDTLIRTQTHVGNPRLWQLNDPYLYRVTARAWMEGTHSFDESSARCGFRDFRYENGYFRLNGSRLFIRSSHTVNAAPVGQEIPLDPDLFRRDLLNMKVMGFNMIRFIWGGATRYQLDLCDEIGLLVYEESNASQPMDDSREMAERFDRSMGELIKRDRNHPSVVIWGLLNESQNNPAFHHAVGALPRIRLLDDTRVVLLNSGRYDGQNEIGSLSNPGGSIWESIISDQHTYPRVPHTADSIRMLSTLGGGKNHVFLSEYGIGSAVDLWRITRRFEQIGKPDAEDAQYYRDRLNDFLEDWGKWKLAECFGRPQDFFAASLRKMAGQRTLGLNAIRANPNLAGYSLTGMMDHVNCGEGLFTLFRDLKPGTVDAIFEGLAPLRLCLFVEPVHVYRGASVHLQAILANEDVLAPGDYPLRVQILGPKATKIFDRTISVRIPDRRGASEPPFALPLLQQEVKVDGPSGEYRFLATFEQGAAPTGGETAFYVTDPADMPAVNGEVALWGNDTGLSDWLNEHRISTRPFSMIEPVKREVILVGGQSDASNSVEEWRQLARRIARGANAIFLSPHVFAKGDQPLGWLPLDNKGALTAIVGWLYLKDEWAKWHPIFDGLQCGDLMDYTYYREIIPDNVWSGQDPPAEAVAGAIKASQDYASGLMVSVYPLGAGRFILNTLLIRENLGKHPAAERLLRNMLNYAARDIGRPLAPLPTDFDEQMKKMGF